MFFFNVYVLNFFRLLIVGEKKINVFFIYVINLKEESLEIFYFIIFFNREILFIIFF